uniref:Uncharacterized protein n=1 Tax=Meloidogyne hapla TaxID=6305 RepID=A0A1I8BD42_MELHA
MFNEDELNAEKNKMGAILFVFNNWFKSRIENKKDLPDYWQKFFKNDKTKFLFFDLNDCVLALDDIKLYNTDEKLNLKLLAGFKALADGELKLENGNFKNNDLFEELTYRLDILRNNFDTKFDKIWKKRQTKRNFENWTKKLMREELFKEIEIMKSSNGKGKKIIENNMEEELNKIKYFVGRLKEDLLSRKIDIDKFASAFDLKENNLKDIFDVLEIKNKPDDLKLKIKQINNLIEENKIIKKENQINQNNQQNLNKNNKKKENSCSTNIKEENEKNKIITLKFKSEGEDLIKKEKVLEDKELLNIFYKNVIDIIKKENKEIKENNFEEDSCSNKDFGMINEIKINDKLKNVKLDNKLNEEKMLNKKENNEENNKIINDNEEEKKKEEKNEVKNEEKIKEEQDNEINKKSKEKLVEEDIKNKRKAKKIKRNNKFWKKKSNKIKKIEDKNDRKETKNEEENETENEKIEENFEISNSKNEEENLFLLPDSEDEELGFTNSVELKQNIENKLEKEIKQLIKAVLQTIPSNINKSYALEDAIFLFKTIIYKW